MKHCFSSMVRHAWCEMKLEMDEGDDSDDDGEMHSVSVAIFFLWSRGPRVRSF